MIKYPSISLLAHASLKIVGFFGPEPSDNSDIIYFATCSGSSVYTSGSSYYYESPYNSPTDCYAPRDLFNVTDADSGIYQLESYETNILIKLQPGVNGTIVAQQIRNFDLDIRTVSSFDEEWQKLKPNEQPRHLQQPTNPRHAKLRTNIRRNLRLSGNRPNRHRQPKGTKPRSHTHERPWLILSATSLDVPHRKLGYHNLRSNPWA